ncbi:MAG: trimeric intracellular cation channel family protein [Propionibacteriales bacterium]|nr:trimeric intracellular cation channel family protein [Propionibacteriales bacterium]
MSPADWLVLLGLAGTAVFAINGALTAIQAARLDIVGVITLGTITAIGGGVLRDILLGVHPPEGLADWRFLVVALAASALVFVVHKPLARLVRWVTVFDAAGLGLFSITGTLAALHAGASPLLAIILGATTAVGGGTFRDLLTSRVPLILTSDLYAIPALLGAFGTWAIWALNWQQPLAYLLAGAACFGLRMVGVKFKLHAPRVQT